MLTAKHCHGAGMVFFTGNDLFSFVSHTVDKQVEHPTLDLLLAHLATPVPDIQVMRLNEGAPPAPGTVCTAIGVGIDRPWIAANIADTYTSSRCRTAG